MTHDTWEAQKGIRETSSNVRYHFRDKLSETASHQLYKHSQSWLLNKPFVGDPVPYIQPARAPMPLPFLWQELAPGVEPAPMQFARPGRQPVYGPRPRRHPLSSSGTPSLTRPAPIQGLRHQIGRSVYPVAAARPQRPRRDEAEIKVASAARGAYAIIGAIFDAGSEIRGAVNAFHAALPREFQARGGAMLHEKVRNLYDFHQHLDFMEALANFGQQRGGRALMGALTKPTFAMSGGPNRGLVSDQTRVSAGTRLLDVNANRIPSSTVNPNSE